MRKVYLVVAALTCAHALMGQNIVPNPSFEERAACPDTYSQIALATPWQTTNMSTDYFNVCHDTLPGSSHVIGIPVNGAGIQASTDSAYIGFYSYNFSNADYREYAATAIPALEVGARYQVMLRVSLADESYYAVNGMGVFFYRHRAIVPGLIPATPQIDYSYAGVLSDKASWVSIIDTFTADSAYTHMVVGNFLTDAAMQKTTLTSTAPQRYAYYYTDSVAVEKITGPAVIAHSSAGGLTARIFPNPFSGHAVLSLDGPAAAQYTVNIVNIHGAVVRSLDAVSGSRLTIEQGDLLPGIYFYQVCMAGSVLFNGRMAIN